MGSKRALNRNKKKCTAYQQRGTLERNKKRKAQNHKNHLLKAKQRKHRNHPEMVEA